jgi:predicted nucleic acid-binding protein
LGLIVVDTSILIDDLRDLPAAGEAIDAAGAAGHEFTASVVSKIELLAGMRVHEKRATRELMAAIDWVEVGDEIAERAGALARTFRRSHQGVGLVDFIIAATVQHLSAQFWTHNTRHYPMFPNLKAPY